MVIIFFQTTIDVDSRRRIEDMRRHVKGLPLMDFDGTDKHELSRLIADQFQYPELPTLSIAGLERDEPQFVQDSPYASVTVYFPYTGDATLFSLYSRSRPAIPGPPVFNAGDRFLSKTYELPKNDLSRIDQLVENEHSSVEQYYADVRRMAPLLNDQILNEACSMVELRVRELNENKAAQAKLSESKIAVRKRTDGSAQVVIPPKRAQIAITQQKVASGPVREYVLETAEYDDILKTISSMVKVMERSPSVFAAMDEESLRTILLVALNGVYEGQATGETFNGHGKTDMLIRRDDRNVFIAECLMWKGPAYLQSKMDEQLFRYAMWRDSKLALIVFNRGVNFTRTLESMRASIEGHPQFLRKLDWKHETGSRYEFRRHDDPVRHFVLTALAFDVPS